MKNSYVLNYSRGEYRVDECSALCEDAARRFLGACPSCILVEVSKQPFEGSKMVEARFTNSIVTIIEDRKAYGLYPWAVEQLREMFEAELSDLYLVTPLYVKMKAYEYTK